MDTTDDIQHVEGVAKGTPTILRNIVRTKPNTQTPKKVITYFQDLVTYTRDR